MSRSSLAYWMMTTLSMVFVGAYAADSVLDATSAASAALPGEGADGARHVAIRGDAERRSIDRIALVTRMAPITLVSAAVRACREVGALWAAAASRHPTLPRRQPSRRGTGCPAGTVAAWRRGSRGTSSPSPRNCTWAGRPPARDRASLSSVIRRPERPLGVALLERTSRTVTLTEAGSVLLRREGRAATPAWSLSFTVELVSCAGSSMN